MDLPYAPQTATMPSVPVSDPHHQDSLHDLDRISLALQQLQTRIDRTEPDARFFPTGDCLRMMSEITDRVDSLHRRLSCPDAPPCAPYEPLSPREREILTWIANGKSNVEIGMILGISRHTVDTHTRRIFRKLETSDRTTAAIRAVEFGLL